MPTFWPPATKDYGIDGNAFLTLPQRVDDWTLTGRGTETGVGVGTGS